MVKIKSNRLITWLKAALQLAVLLFLTTVFSVTSVAQERLHQPLLQSIHQPWQSLLAQHVKPINNGHSSQVDYASFKTERAKLKAYLATLGSVDEAVFSQWSAAKQLAFLINAYNAWTVEFILTAYPDLESIKDLGSFFSSPWSKKFIPLLGEIRSLDDIEHKLIRGDNKYGDPRIHFAVNCASIGCPALREEAYSADKLEQQLSEQTVRFITDTSRNRFNEDNMELSTIFKWYGNDFTLGFRGSNSLAAFIMLYHEALNLTSAQQALLSSKNMATTFLKYDWALNAVR